MSAENNTIERLKAINLLLLNEVGHLINATNEEDLEALNAISTAVEALEKYLYPGTYEQ